MDHPEREPGGIGTIELRGGPQLAIPPSRIWTIRQLPDQPQGAREIPGVFGGTGSEPKDVGLPSTCQPTGVATRFRRPSKDGARGDASLGGR